MEPAPPPRRSAVFLKFFGFGVGTAVGIAICVGLLFWIESRPRRAKAWNSGAILATYDYADTEGEKNTLILSYVLENKTPTDYNLEKKPIFLAQLEKQGSLAQSVGEELVKIDLPVFLPAHRRQRFQVHLMYESPIPSSSKSTPEQRKNHSAAVEKFVRDELSNLGGFSLFDEAMRYEIRFPKGW